MIVDGDSVGGSCDNDRTARQATASETPLCSLQRALEIVPSGSEILVRAGTYPRVFVKDRQNAGYVTVKPYGSEKVILQGLETTRSSGFRFEGLRITDLVLLFFDSRRIQLVRNNISPRGIAVRARSSDIRIEGNYIHDIARDPACAAGSPDGTAIWVTGGFERVDRIIIRNNRITRVPIDAMQFGSTFGVTIEGNEISSVWPVCEKTAERDRDHADAIQVLGGGDYRIRSNFVHDNTAGFIIHEGGGPFVLENNVVVRTQGWATQVFTRPALRIVNNTWWDNGAGGLILRGSRDDASPFEKIVLVNNIIDRLAGEGALTFAKEDHNLIRLGSFTGRNDSRKTPTFVAPRRRDYRLAPGSAGIDAGTSESAPSRDRLGQRRFDEVAIRNRGGGRRRYYDIGAHEYRPRARR